MFCFKLTVIMRLLSEKLVYSLAFAIMKFEFRSFNIK